MEVQRVLLDTLRCESHLVKRQEFLRQYPGAFLLAMGYLAVEKMGVSHFGLKSGEKQHPTTSVVFGAKMRHDAGQSHPLAGIAFFMRPTRERLFLIIGRSESCDIAIPEPSVSDRHCRIDVTSEGVFVQDLSSTNGTTVNLDPLQARVPQLLADEDIITLGRYSFQLLSAKALFDELALLRALDDYDKDDTEKDIE